MPVVTVPDASIRNAVKYPTLPVAANSLDGTVVTPTDTSGIEFTASGREVVIVQNTAGAPGTFTVVSTADAQNRTGDMGPYTVAAGGFAWVSPPTVGFIGATGKITITVSAATMKFIIFRVPNSIF
jgi:hypothetical protein